jgi:glycosyltransferase involved in cell wall biosynthesis
LEDLRRIGVDVVVFQTHCNAFKAVREIAGFMFSNRAEIVHTHFVNRYVRFATPIIARLFGMRKTIASVRSHPSWTRRSIGRIRYIYYDYVLSVSNSVAKSLVRAGVNSKRVHTHYQGLFDDEGYSREHRIQCRSMLGIAENATVLVCIAWDNPVKGLDILLDAVKLIHQHCFPVHLIVIGVDPKSSTLPDRAIRLGLSKWVHWLGIMDGARRILCAADIYVQPSRSEGLALATLEAMSLKLPVVATRVGGTSELVINGETGYLAHRADPASLAGALEKMLCESNSWKSMGETGYLRYLRRFKGEKSIKTLVEDYYGLN